MTKILIVEDEETHVDLLQRAFEDDQHNYELTIVNRLKAAQTRLEGEDYDLIIVDWMLPDGKGIDLLQDDNGQLPKQYPFLIMTSHGNESVAVEAMKSGALDYVVKSAGIFRDMPRIVERLMREWGHIHARQKAEKEVRRTAAELRTYIEAAAQGVLVFNENYEITLANHEAERIFAYATNELVGYSIERLFPEAFRDKDKKRLRSLLLDPNSVPLKAVELEAIKKDGSIFPIEINVSRVDSNNQPTAIAIFTDITERKRLQAEAEETRQIQAELAKEKELRKYKDRFLSMFSHEFRTPLTVIHTSTYLLKNYSDRMKSDAREQHLTRILEQIKTLDQMVEDILLLSKREQQGLEFKPQLINLNQFVKETIDISAKLATNMRVDCESNIQQEMVYLDPLLMKHVLTNLVGNAIKYSPGKDEVRVKVISDEAHVVFTISDDGIGIPKEDLKNIFDVFHRANNVGEIQGTGLGLAIVSEFVAMHGGTIDLESEPGNGTKVTIHIPTLER